ncbi:hypothetical protein [Mycolicibacterium llatzerense]|uniref:hypothetical protein n=1 Tax=Mycolicibacterium llatzerense TaxID=280871 RepID=UPI0021B62F22|nr:hypothetical protein [Mycolicibacterium llatzerense]
MKVTLYDTDPETTVTLASKFEVCPRCHGRGVHDCWEGGMTGAEMAEQGPEFFEDYRAGMYSTTCTVCHGLRVVEVLDRPRVPADLLTRYDAQEAEHAEYEAMAAAERRYCGNY